MFILRANLTLLKSGQRFIFFRRNAKLSIYPNVSLFDEDVNVSIDGLKPNGLFSICSHIRNEERSTFSSVAIFKSTECGTINLAKDNAIGGMYKGIHPMGFIWSMQPSPTNKKPHAKLRIRDVESPLKVSLEVYEGVIPNLETYIATKEKPLTENALYRTVKCPGVQRIPIDGDFQGTLFIPEGNGPFPGVITMYGYSNDIEQRGALLASRGILSLALSFFGRPGLTATLGGRVQLEYFEKAIEFIGSHPMVRNCGGIGVIGTCLAGTVALSLSTVLDGIKAVILINPGIYTDAVYFTYKDIKFPKSTVNSIEYKMKPNQPNTWNGYTLPKEGFEEEYLIPFHKRKDVDYMFLFSEDDRHMPSNLYNRVVENLLEKEKHEKYKIVFYKKAGHMLDIPNLPLCEKEWLSVWKNIIPYGGDPEFHNKAEVDAWENIVNFFHQVLQ